MLKATLQWCSWVSCAFLIAYFLYITPTSLVFLDLEAKEGPIYNVEWNPQGSEFCAVYGFMPAKATLYDLKGDPKFDFGTGPRNSAFYNRFGNYILFFIAFYQLLVLVPYCS